MADSEDLLKCADHWSVVGRDLVHTDICYRMHTPCLIGALADRIRTLDKEKELCHDVIRDALKMLDGTVWYQKHRAIIEPLRGKFR
jgi:hypothetical protein